MNYQLKQIRTALAVASLLNRTLEMPPLWCRFDRMWFGHPGIMEGTITTQPFICPMDHVFEVEDSFLEVQLCDEQSTKCHVGNETTRGSLRFFKHSSQEKFIEVFSSYKDVKIIKFSSMQDAFQGFTVKEREAMFRNRVKPYVGIWCCVVLMTQVTYIMTCIGMKDQVGGSGIWCCVETHDPGHIYCDMYWDEGSGWKPEPPKTREDDHPPW